MTEGKTFTIDGQEYDRITGLPIASSKPVAPVQPASTLQAPARTARTAAPNATIKLQKSHTLRRRALKRPAYSEHAVIRKTTPHATVVSKKHMDFTHQAPNVSPHIKRFASHPAGAIAKRPTTVADRPAPVLAGVAKASAKSAAQAQPLTNILASSQIKDQAIAEAKSKTVKQKPLKNGFFRRNQRAVSMFAATLAVVMLGGYFTYINMPSLSVRMAASQAGINAAYPTHPTGYALNGSVIWAEGRVSMNFKANAGTQNYTVNQIKSSWDSEALLDNYVSSKAGVNYSTVTERGLKIYTYDNNAAWVNGGVMYTIEGDAPLSSMQIRDIAKSLM